MKQKGSAKLRQMLRNKELIVSLGVFDVMGALIVEAAGFKAVSMGGSGTSMFTIGYPDVGLITMDEMIANAGRIASLVNIPVISDADTGFGDAIGTARTVREFIQSGVAAIHMEDQISPKRCGHTAGKICISTEEMVGKIRAACDTRDQHDPDFVIIARTDFRGAVGGSLDGAIDRCQKYAAVGADVVFCEGLLDAFELKRVIAEVPVPICYNMAGISPAFTEQELISMGVGIAKLTAMQMTAAFAGIRELVQHLKSDLTYEKRFMKEHNLELSDIFEFSGVEKIRELEERYLPKEVLDTHYSQGSVGLFSETKTK